MATNTSALKTFAQQTRIKLISLIKTKLQFVLTTIQQNFVVMKKK